MSLHELIDLFIDDVCAGKTNETAKTYRLKLAHLTKFLGEREITSESIKAFLHSLSSRKNHKIGSELVPGGLSVFTIKTVTQTTRHFCRWLYENGHIPNDVAKEIKIPITPPPAPKAVREDVMNAMFKAAAEHGEYWERVRNLAMLYFLRDTGCRISGLANAELSKLDLKRGRIETFEKGKNVTLYIEPPTVSMLKLWIQERAQLGALTDHIFISRKTRLGITRRGVDLVLRRLAQQANVSTERINAHAWRHAFARDFLTLGGEITQLAGIMHHSSIWVTTNYYARWADDELRDAHKKSSPINSIQPWEISQ